MSDTREQAIFVAVIRAVQAGIKAKPVYQPGGGNVMWWPLVAKVLAYLHPDRQAIHPKALAKKYKRLRQRETPESLDAMAASVDSAYYLEAVRLALGEGEVPSTPPPVVPGLNVPLRVEESLEQPERPKKKREPTPEELDALTPEEILNLTDMDIQIEQALAKARFYQRLYSAAKQRAAFVSTACTMLRDIVQTLEPVKWNPANIPAVHICRKQEAVLLLSDIHIGDEIKADTMGALNVYNYAVFQEKTKRLYAGVKESLEVLREWGNVSRLRVFYLGDVTTGVNIFPGQAHHIEFGAMQQAIKGADELSMLMRMCLELPGIEKADIEAIPGNHGRPGKKGNDPFEDNWDCVCYEFMKQRLAAEKRIQFNWHYSWWMMPSVLGWNFLCAHGDEVKAWNGIPNYGFRRWGSRWRELLDSVGKRYDYGVIGHHHTEVEEKNLIISGAWPGASFFSAKELQSGGEATQMFYSVSEDRGIVWRRRLPLDPPKRVISP